jgi:glutathione synthase
MPAKPSHPHSPRALVVMDPIDEIKPVKDTTLAMLLAAQKRGWELWYAEQRDLWLRDGVANGRVRPISVRNDLHDWFTLDTAHSKPLADFQVILMRKDPPFDMEYIYTTYILERAQEQGVLVANRPQGLRDMNEKVFTAWFPQCCAPTLITRDMADMHACRGTFPTS